MYKNIPTLNQSLCRLRVTNLRPWTSMPKAPRRSLLGKWNWPITFSEVSKFANAPDPLLKNLICRYLMSIDEISKGLGSFMSFGAS